MNLLSELKIYDADTPYLITLYDESAHTKIGSLNNLLTPVKSDIVNSLNSEVTARENADTLLNERIDNNKVYNPSDLSGTGKNIGLKEGEYTVESNMTINSQLIIPNGAEINVKSGATLTINGQVLAGRYHIFKGSGNIVINSPQNSIIYPEWFGAVGDTPNADCGIAINKAINSASTGCIIDFAPTTYYVRTPIVCNKVMTLQGIRDKTYITAGTSNCSPIITISGSGSNYVDGAVIKNMTLGRYSELDSSIGLYITRCANTLIQNIRLANFAQCIRYKFTTSTRTEGCIALTALAQNNFFGYLLDCTADAPLANTSANGSCYFINCSVNISVEPRDKLSTGFYITGKDMRDIYLDNCETSKCSIGVNFDGTANTMATDIRISGVFDLCRSIGIRVKNIPMLDGGVKIHDCFISLDSTTNPSQAIYVETSYNVSVSNTEIYSYLSNVPAIAFVGCSRCSINNVLCNHSSYGIVIDENSSYIVASNIRIIRTQSSATDCALLVAGNKNNIANVTILGAYNLGLSVGGDNNIVIGTISDVTGTKYSDTGTNNQIYYVS